MRHRLLTLVLLFVGVLVPRSTRSGEDVYLAAGESGLNPFLMYVRNGSFISAPGRWSVAWRHVLARFPVGQALEGIAADGRPRRVVVTRVEPAADDYETAIEVDPRSADVLLATSPPARLTFVPSLKATLKGSVVVRLREESRRIWGSETGKLPVEDRPHGSLEVGDPQALGVPGSPGLVAVVLPASFARRPGEAPDSRGSFFFLVEGATGEVRFARFGHPEWSVNSPPSVTQILPVFFFKIGGVPGVFLLARHAFGWESSGLAILDPRSARVVALTEGWGPGGDVPVE